MSETAIAPPIDKSAWGPGAWQDEPDRVDFVHAGFACMVLRHPRHGHLCGYVGVGPDHPLHWKSWSDDPGFSGLSVHRGINYSFRCDGHICHIPKPGMPADVWWIGFDCGHVWDLSPGINASLRSVGLPDRIESPFREVYRDLHYVRRETESLAEQLAELYP